MKKLSLDLNQLRVDTFRTLDHTVAGPRGTVRANQHADTLRGDTMIMGDTMAVGDTMVMGDTLLGDTMLGGDTVAIGDTVP